jgi:tetratricopeptide (TPR) repeat protein
MNPGQSSAPSFSVADQEWKRRERDNLWVALRWARDNTMDMGLSFAPDVTLAGYIDPSHARTLLQDLLDNSPTRGLPRARALRRAAVVAAFEGDYEGSVSLAEAGVRLARELGDTQELGHILMTLGQSRQGRGDFDGALQALEEAISLADGGGNIFLATVARTCLGELALQRGDYASARDILAECVAQSRSIHHEAWENQKRRGLE